MTPQELVARFEDLLSKATPAPWHWTGSGDAYHEAREGKPRADYDYEGEMHSPHVCDGPPGWPNCRQDDVHFDSPVMVCQTDGGVYVHNDVDFQLWEAARNDLPALLAHLRAQQDAARKLAILYKCLPGSEKVVDLYEKGEEFVITATPRGEICAEPA